MYVLHKEESGKGDRWLAPIPPCIIVKDAQVFTAYWEDSSFGNMHWKLHPKLRYSYFVECARILQHRLDMRESSTFMAYYLVLLYDLHGLGK